MAEKLFNLEEAERLLPAVEKLLRAALESKKSMEAADEAFNNLRQRIMQLGGSLPDRSPLAALRQQREQSGTDMQEALQQIDASGVLVKDLDIGLVDFPSMLNDREIYLCWKLGEGRIGFWHHVEDGFSGRKPVDREFLRNIQREKPH